MTKDEFIDGYCARSGITREFFLANGDAVPCDCGEGSCAGWRYETQDEDCPDPVFLQGLRDDPVLTITAQQAGVLNCDPPPGHLVFVVNAKPVVFFKSDGTIELGEGYTLTEAGEAFIELLRNMLPSKAENDKLVVKVENAERALQQSRAKVLKEAQNRLAAHGGVKPLCELTQSEETTWRIAVLACCAALHELADEGVERG